MWDEVGQSGAPEQGTGVLALKVKVERMFLGQFYHNIDDKGRLTIPARFRDQLEAEEPILMQGFDQNLLLLTSANFNILSQRMNSMSLTDPTARLLKRLIFSTAHQVELDKVGRILVPQFLREAIDLQGEAVVVGSGNYVEIWSPVQWKEQAAQLSDAQLNAHRFAALDLSTA